MIHNNRVFVASFLGFEENLPLFDRIVETITVSSRYENFETGDFDRMVEQFETILASIRLNARRDEGTGTVSP